MGTPQPSITIAPKKYLTEPGAPIRVTQYKVVAAENALEPAIGSILAAEQVQGLMDAGLRVKIRQARN